MSVRLSYADVNANGTIQPASEILEENNYYPFGLKHKGYNEIANSNRSEAAEKYKFGGKELNSELGLDLYDFGARNYDPALGRWLNPFSEKFISATPYNYTLNNPISNIDPDGRFTLEGLAAQNFVRDLQSQLATKDNDGDSTGVKRNNDGTYSVVGVNLKDNDNGVYIVDSNGKWNKDSKLVGYTATLYSFYNDDDRSKVEMRNAVINPNDYSGAEFLTNFMENTPSLLNYVNNAKGTEYYDFKTTNATSQQIYCNVLDFYRGMPVGSYNKLPVFASARDVGNIAAGYMAASKGISWRNARYFGFDALQTSQKFGKGETLFFYPFLHTPEARGSQAGQLLGYKYYDKYGKK